MDRIVQIDGYFFEDWSVKSDRKITFRQFAVFKSGKIKLLNEITMKYEELKEAPHWCMLITKHQKFMDC